MRKLRFDEALLPEGWAQDVTLHIADGRIARVETGGADDGAERIAGAALPGMPNLHSHAFQRGMAGLSERQGGQDDSFWTWREVMYRFLDRLDPDDMEAIAAQAYVEMLEAGFTGVAEFHYLHHTPDGRAYANPAEMAERIAAAAAATGIGLTLLPVLYRWGNFGSAPPTSGQRRFLSDHDAFAHLLDASERAIRAVPDAALGVAPHSLRAVSPDDLRFAAALRPDAPLHLHAAEQEKEVADSLAWSGRRAVEWLLDEAELGPRWCLIHATHMTSDETRRLAATGAVAGLCPVTEANLGDGIFPAGAYRAAGGRFGVGTDSNILIGVADELRALEYAQRLQHRRRNRLAEPGGSVGRTLYEAALAGGAQASGRRIGALAVGCSADIVVLDTGHPALVARAGDALLDGFVFAARTPPVREVYARGDRVVEGRRHRGRDAVAARFARVLARILA